MGKSQRNKGAGGEREWCAKLATRGINVSRQLGQARDGGGDVIAEPYLFEVKRRKGIAVRKFLDQAAAATRMMAVLDNHQKPTLRPVVAMREDGNTEWMVLMSADTFLDLVAATRMPGWNLLSVDQTQLITNALNESSRQIYPAKKGTDRG